MWIRHLPFFGAAWRLCTFYKNKTSISHKDLDQDMVAINQLILTNNRVRSGWPLSRSLSNILSSALLARHSSPNARRTWSKIPRRKTSFCCCIALVSSLYNRDAQNTRWSRECPPLWKLKYKQAQTHESKSRTRATVFLPYRAIN